MPISQSTRPQRSLPGLSLGMHGLPKVVLAHASGSRAEVYLHGGHVTGWSDQTGHEWLYLSDRAEFGNGKSIRGGIPVVFPQFADTGPLPKHGLLRTRTWSIRKLETNAISLAIRESEETLALWPHRFTVDLHVSVDDNLTVAMTVTNSDASPFTFTTALHGYLRVRFVEDVAVHGLSGCQFTDKIRGQQTFRDEQESLRITGETDRIYIDPPNEVTIAHAANGRSLVLRSEGFGNWVVWNPWEELTKTLSDMKPDDYRQMLCVEASRITQPITLNPGEQWTGRQVFAFT